MVLLIARVVAALLAASLMLPTTVAGGQDIEIRMPELLFNEPLNDGSGVAGRWQQGPIVRDAVSGALHADLELHLEPFQAGLEPGPIVIFWRLKELVDDPVYQGTSVQPAGPVQSGAFDAECDRQRECSVVGRLGVDVPDLDGLVGLRLDFTVVRTFEDGQVLQVLPPEPPREPSSGGTLTEPTSTVGTFFGYQPFSTSRASPVPLAGPGGGERLDYARVVTELLGGPIQSSAPIPVRLPSASSLAEGPLLTIELDFTEPCPADRALRISNDAHPAQTQLFSLANRSSIRTQVRIASENSWTVSLLSGSEGVIDSRQIERGVSGAELDGSISCIDAKGEWGTSVTVEPDEPDEPTVDDGQGSSSPVPVAAVVGGIVVALLAGGVWLLRALRR